MRTSICVPRRTFMGHSAAALALLPITGSLLGCSSDDEAPGGSGKSALEAFADAIDAQTVAAVSAHQSQLDTISIASLGFALSLTQSAPPIEASGPHADALATTALTNETWVSRADAMLDAAIAQAASSEPSSAPLVFMTPGYKPLGEKVGSAESPLLLTAALLVGGLVLTAYGAYKGTKKAVDLRAQPVKDKIDAATPAELGVINETLGLDTSTSKDETAKHFADLGMGKKLSKAKAIEQELRNAVVDGVPDVNDVSAAAINQSVASSSVELGKTAVTTTVSVSTSVTGGQGYAQAMEAAGVSQGVAATVDFGISAVSTVADQPLQPLDILAKHLDIAVVDKDKTALTIPKPSTDMSLSEAKKVLGDAGASAQELDDAMAVVATGAANTSPEGFGVSENEDGSITVMAPARVHLGRIDDPTNHITMKVPDMGPADVLILAEGKAPQIIENIDTSVSPIVSYEATDIEDYEPPESGTYSLLTIATPADPGPGEAVNVTAQITPADYGIPIRLSIVGTDGYTDSNDTVTDDSGQATLFIPGGAEGVVDTVTVELPEQGLSQTMSYSF